MEHLGQRASLATNSGRVAKVLARCHEPWRRVYLSQAFLKVLGEASDLMLSLATILGLVCR